MNVPNASLSPFVLLADPQHYVACNWDLGADEPSRVHWVGFFKTHFQMMLKLALTELQSEGLSAETATRNCLAAANELDGVLTAYAEDPRSTRWGGRVTILTLDRWRDAILRRYGIRDAFASLKRRENEGALPELAWVIFMHEALPTGIERCQSLIRGVFAGNIFDMGAEATSGRFLNGSVSFSSLLGEIKPRPWLIDDFDLLTQRWLSTEANRWQKIVYFIDNAGGDFLLGALPLIRQWALEGREVVIAANERPSLNDMTVHDVFDLWPRIIAIAPELSAVKIVSTGTGEPLIDLGSVSDDLNVAAAHADLVVLEGMGRGVESNLDAAFHCDVLNIAILKDHIIARRHGGTLYDCVCQFKPARANVR